VPTVVTQPPAVTTQTTGPALLPPPGGATTIDASGLPGPGTGVIRVRPTQPRITPPTQNVEPPGSPLLSEVELSVFLGGDVVASTQTALSGLGLYRGPINGALTGPTRAAIRAFQRDLQLPATGELDLRTAQALGVITVSPPVTGTPGTVAPGTAGTATAGTPQASAAAAATTGADLEGVPRTGEGVPTVIFLEDVPLIDL
jgi:peptidoglycan hydrolase-like protein with peptidoglycan-binding domain